MTVGGVVGLGDWGFGLGGWLGLWLGGVMGLWLWGMGGAAGGVTGVAAISIYWLGVNGLGFSFAVGREAAGACLRVGMGVSFLSGYGTQQLSGCVSRCC